MRRRFVFLHDREDEGTIKRKEAANLVAKTMKRFRVPIVNYPLLLRCHDSQDENRWAPIRRHDANGRGLAQVGKKT